MAGASQKPALVSNRNGPDLTVMIIASGPFCDSDYVHAVAASQPLQSWTVLRSHDDFYAVSDVLSQLLPNSPACPVIEDLSGDFVAIVNARNKLQEWLTEFLTYPGATDTLAVQNFLTYRANTILPRYEGVSWTSFTPDGQAVAPQQQQQQQQQHRASSEQVVTNLDDMEMDDMFENGDEVDDDEDDEGDVDYPDDDEDYILPSERYKPLDEAITAEDEMDMMTGEVEMIDDVGSLAQSLGASHLGRSLQLQAEMASREGGSTSGAAGTAAFAQQKGLKIGAGPTSRAANGGLGSAIEKAGIIEGVGDSFNSTPPISAPRLDSFKMIKVIGRGSFGKVFLVKEIQTSRMYALKVLTKDHVVKRNQVEHTRTERSVLGYVKHPFIVGMNMAFQSKHKLYFVLDYCAGGELFFHLGKLGKFPESRAKFYAAEIILALSYIHDLDIVYRDLKPENVLLDTQGHIRLTDFGLSKEGISSSSSGAYSFCGTPEYLAPEILNRQGHGRAVDWWSLGALLFEMLTGLPPFYCQDRERLFEKIKKSELQYPASVSKLAKSLLKGLLTKDPTKRLGSGPDDANEIKTHDLFAGLQWEKLNAGTIKPPWTPQINGSLDTSQFDKQFTNMPVFSPQSLQRASHLGSMTTSDNLFEGFTFTERQLHGPARTQAGS